MNLTAMTRIELGELYERTAHRSAMLYDRGLPDDAEENLLDAIGLELDRRDR